MKSAHVNDDYLVDNIIAGVMNGFIECGDAVQIGWMYDPGTGLFSPPPVVFSPPPDPAEVLQSARLRMTLSPVQLRLKLLAEGLLDGVESIAAANREIGIWYEYATVIERLHPAVAALAEQFGKDDEWLDVFFTGF